MVLVAPAALAVCLAHPIDIDREVGRRALPWLPPDLARQVARHEREFAGGAAAAARWPWAYHRPGGAQGVERTIEAQCQRLVKALHDRAPFSDVVAGLGALAHLTVDLGAPFAAARGGDAHAAAFASYLRSATPRIPIVFYGQRTTMLAGKFSAFAPLLQVRRHQADELASLVRADLDRTGGPASWPRLDDRSTSFGAASLVLNHATTDFAVLASWVWQHAGGLVPPIPTEHDEILVWQGAPQPRPVQPLPIEGETSHVTPRSRLGFR